MARAKENYEKMKAASGAITDVLRRSLFDQRKGHRGLHRQSHRILGRQHHLRFRFSQPSPGHEIALGNPAALRHAGPQELRSHDRAKPGALGTRPQGSDARPPIQSRRVLPARCRRRPSSQSNLCSPPGSAGTSAPRRRAHSSRWRATCRRYKIQRRSKMGVVMIKCPETGHAIPTGMKADRERFRCSPVFFARTFCSICEANHEWFAREAWVHEPEEKWRMHEPHSPCNRRRAVEAVLQFPGPQWPRGRWPVPPWVRVRRCTSPALANRGVWRGDRPPAGASGRLHLLRQA